MSSETAPVARALAWRQVAARALGDRVVDFAISPDDRHAAICCQPSRRLQVVDLATGASVFSRGGSDVWAVRWVAPGAFVAMDLARRAPALVLFAVGRGDELARWNCPRPGAGSVRFAMTDDGRHGALLTDMTPWRVEVTLPAPQGADAPTARLAVERLDVPMRSPGMGHSAQRTTRLDVDRVTGAALLVHQADANKPLEACVVDVRAGTWSEWTRTTVDRLDGTVAMPRWVAPGRLLWAERTADGHLVRLTDAPPTRVMREARASRDATPPDADRALASLVRSACHEGGARVFSWEQREGRTTRGWVTRMDDPARFEPTAPWPARVESAAWMGDALVVLTAWPTEAPRLWCQPAVDREPSRVAVGYPGEFASGLPPRVEVSPCARWVVLAREDRVAWAPSASLVDAREAR